MTAAPRARPSASSFVQWLSNGSVLRRAMPCYFSFPSLRLLLLLLLLLLLFFFVSDCTFLPRPLLTRRPRATRSSHPVFDFASPYCINSCCCFCCFCCVFFCIACVPMVRYTLWCFPYFFFAPCIPFCLFFFSFLPSDCSGCVPFVPIRAGLKHRTAAPGARPFLCFRLVAS